MGRRERLAGQRQPVGAGLFGSASLAIARQRFIGSLLHARKRPHTLLLDNALSRALSYLIKNVQRRPFVFGVTRRYCALLAWM